MKVGRLPAVLLIPVVALASCVTTERVYLRASPSPGYSDSANRLLVFVQTGDTIVKIAAADLDPGAQVVESVEEPAERGTVYTPFDLFLAKRLEVAFKELGVETKAVVVTPLDLTEDRIQETRQAFPANKWLQILFIGDKMSLYPLCFPMRGEALIRTLTFALTVTDELSGTTVWRADLNVKGMINTTTADEMIGDIALALNNGRIIHIDPQKVHQVVVPDSLVTAGSIILVGACMLVVYIINTHSY